MSNEKSLIQYMATRMMEDSKREREMGDVLHDAVLKIAALEPLNEKLVAALRFYAEGKDWDEFRSDEQAAAFDRNTGSKLGDDSGAVARAALTAAGVEL